MTLQGLQKHCFLLVLLVALATSTKAEEVRLCQNIRLLVNISPPLSKTEQILACGDATTPETPLTAPWRVIPLSQSKFHLEAFLQSRGYFSSTFKREADHWVVETGSKSVIKKVSLIVDGKLSTEDHLSRKRNLIGQTLTPEALNQIEQWTRLRFEAIGYPCPRVRSLADSKTGEIQLFVEQGPKQNITWIREEPIAGLAANTLRRNDAFQLGDPFNREWLILTERRNVSNGIVQSLNLTGSCGPEGAVIEQTAIAGPPRLLTAGFGLNTEGFFIVRTSWSNNRLGQRASNLNFLLTASVREQEVNGTLTLFNLPYASRRFVRPQARIRHQNEKFFEVLTTKARVTPGTTWDGKNIGLTFLTGPAFDYIRTFRGTGPLNSHFLSYENELSLMTHSYEYYRTSPRTGGNVGLFAAFGTKDILSVTSAQRLRINGEALFNYKNYDPPLFIIGIRGSAATTVTAQASSNVLPPNFRHYLGGSLDLRGFGRQELPESGTGSLSSAFGGIEFRLADVKIVDLQPFSFIDFGALGQKALSLDSPLFWSPGVGLRWESPLGAFRGTVAHGFSSDETYASLSHWQIYLSLGEEF